MKDSNDELIDLLQELRRIYPDWRLGQLVCNVAVFAKGPNKEAVWDMEDAEFIRAAREHLKCRDGLSLEKIQRAVEKTVGGSVSHVESKFVVETFRGKMIWRGVVEVFSVSNPPPEKAYGWVVVADGSPDYVTVLGTPPINAPLDAVRAWIVSQGKN